MSTWIKIRATSATCKLVLLALACIFPVLADEYERQENPQLDYVFVKKGSDFSSYKAVIIDAISVWYPVDSAPPEDKSATARANLEKAQNLFRKLIENSLDEEHRIAEEAGNDVLRLHAEFIDLRSITSPDQIPVYITSKKFRTAPGHITVVAELSDSVSGEVLARIADIGKKQSSGGSVEVNWAAIEADLQNWARIFSDWFNSIHPH